MVSPWKNIFVSFKIRKVSAPVVENLKFVILALVGLFFWLLTTIMKLAKSALSSVVNVILPMVCYGKMRAVYFHFWRIIGVFKSLDVLVRSSRSCPLCV
jgi:hypothetical protein